MLFPTHAVLVGDNNTGKSTIFEALDLALGPGRVSHSPVVDEHDFYQGEYYSEDSGKTAPKIEIEATITDLKDEQKIYFHEHMEFWNSQSNSLINSSGMEFVDNDESKHAFRVCFIGEYDAEEDDFLGKTCFAKSIDERDDPKLFLKRDKQKCGFLYLRSIRTGSRALTLEHSSLFRHYFAHQRNSAKNVGENHRSAIFAQCGFRP